MAQRNTLAHFLHDAGLAVWFGGTLAGAVAVNGAAADVDDPRQRARVANAGWARWTPVNAAAIGCHLLGGAQLLRANRGRVKHQQGVLANTNVKLGLTAAALGATAYARVLGKQVQAAGDVPVDGGTSPNAATPPAVAKAQKQLAALQWAIPALTGGILLSSSLHEEQQTTAEVLRGTVKGLPDTLSRSAATAAAATAAVVLPAAKEARDALTPRAKDAGERISVVARDAAAAIVPAARDARETVTPYVASARDAVTPYVRDARDSLVPMVKDAREVLAPYAATAGTAISDAGTSLSKGAKSGYGKVAARASH
ncbi:MAG: hypothetical protein JWL64_1410 [Frankiales bacterium]|nr:hypothetical protein [Frankiales bacterium]